MSVPSTTAPVRICLLIRQLNLGGAQRQLLTLASGLDKKRFAVSVATFYPGGVFAAECSRLAGVELVSLNKLGRWDLVLFPLRLLAYLRRSRPQILYSFLGGSNLFAALSKPLLPGTKVVWGIRSSAADSGRYDFAQRFTLALERRLSRLPDRVVANSEAGARDVIAAGFPAAKVVTISNGIDADRFAPCPEAARALRHCLGLPPGALVVGMVARFDPMKDHATFFAAAARLRQQHPKLALLLIGSGSPESVAAAHRLAEKSGLGPACHWLGICEEMPAIYSAMDLLVLCSAFGEGLPNAVAEGMACGVPCVVTDVGDSACLVGDTGVVVPPADPGALAAGIEHLLKRLEAEPGLRRSSRQRIVDHFGPRRLVDRTTELFERILAC